jgi:hypothetical protein
MMSSGLHLTDRSLVLCVEEKSDIQAWHTQDCRQKNVAVT